MSERMTSIYVGSGLGFAEYGRKTVPEMIESIRKHAAHLKKEADEILAAADEDFHVETYVGSIVQRNRKVLQEGRKRR